MWGNCFSIQFLLIAYSCFGILLYCPSKRLPAGMISENSLYEYFPCHINPTVPHFVFVLFFLYLLFGYSEFVWSSHLDLSFCIRTVVLHQNCVVAKNKKKTKKQQHLNEFCLEVFCFGEKFFWEATFISFFSLPCYCTAFLDAQGLSGSKVPYKADPWKIYVTCSG